MHRNLLHGIVGSTADVTWDDNQAGRLETGQQNNQIDLEPQLVVARLKGGEFGGESRQGQVQHGVPNSCVFDDGDVSLRKTWFTG